MKSRFIAFVLVLCLILTLSVTALAAQESRMIQQLTAEPGKLSMILACQEEQGEYSATLDGKELSLTGSTVKKEAVPITVYCLVDIKGPANKDAKSSSFRKKLINDTLTEISQSMSDGDQMIITTVVGSEFTEGKVLTAEQARQDAIEKITISEKVTCDLYAGIVKSLGCLGSATDLNPMRALVILSEGAEKSSSDYPEQEVLNAIAKTSVPIYTVALTTKSENRNTGIQLSSFARSSCGGFHQTTLKEGDIYVNEKASGQEFGAAIWKNISDCSFLTADLSELPLDASKVESKLTVTYTANTSAYSDSVTVTTANLVVPTEPPTEPSTDPSTDPTTDPTPPKPDPSMYPWMIVAVLVVAAIVVMVVIMVNKRKAEEEARRRAEEEARRRAEEEKRKRIEEERILIGARPACYLEMVDIPHGNHAKRFVVPYGESVTFGRTEKSKYILDNSDSQLSGLHFTMIVQPDSICVRDERSTNGTYINGVSIAGTGWKKMRSGDKLKAGCREYRVLVIDENA